MKINSETQPWPCFLICGKNRTKQYGKCRSF